MFIPESNKQLDECLFMGVFYPSAHRFVFCGRADFLSLAVGVLLTSLLLLDNPTDVILELIEKTLLLPDCQCHVSRSGVLDGNKVSFF